MDSPHGAAISSALAELESALERLTIVATGFPPANLATLQRYRSAVVPAAASLALALQVHWHSPEQLHAAQRVAARAAATRSCAYLRCASLGGEGGARASTGVSSKRCRWVPHFDERVLEQHCIPPPKLHCRSCANHGRQRGAALPPHSVFSPPLLLPAPAAWRGTAALPARTPTGARGTAGLARRWLRRGSRPRLRRRSSSSRPERAANNCLILTNGHA